jgi:hypothetical protein
VRVGAREGGTDWTDGVISGGHKNRWWMDDGHRRGC